MSFGEVRLVDLLDTASTPRLVLAIFTSGISDKLEDLTNFSVKTVSRFVIDD